MTDGDIQSLQQVIAANRAGRPVGIYAVCSAHPVALEAAMRQGRQDGTTVLIEATANQVNQFGGYTNMRPADFRRRVEKVARKAGVPGDRIVLGGDHLGPTCWAGEPAEQAMAKARALVAAYAAAGFGKVHLDTSMACGGDAHPPAGETVAIRAAELCATAEQAARERFGASELLYVIGAEVPAPGGGAEGVCGLRVTDAAAARLTIETHQAAFLDKGLGDAWERVIALVVQPGVEFDNGAVRAYAPAAARPLSALIAAIPKLAFEAHSTDYQDSAALTALIRDHFAILKVGPQLTHALREALVALCHIEAELVAEENRSRLLSVCEQAMLSEPGHWRGYCPGEGLAGRAARRFGYSDRMRYYWNKPAVAAAAGKLVRNLSGVEIPLPLLGQYLPLQYEAVRAGLLPRGPRALVLDHVMRVARRYARACGGAERHPPLPGGAQP